MVNTNYQKVLHRHLGFLLRIEIRVVDANDDDDDDVNTEKFNMKPEKENEKLKII